MVSGLRSVGLELTYATLSMTGPELSYPKGLKYLYGPGPKPYYYLLGLGPWYRNHTC